MFVCLLNKISSNLIPFSFDVLVSFMSFSTSEKDVIVIMIIIYITQFFRSWYEKTICKTEFDAFYIQHKMAILTWT